MFIRKLKFNERNVNAETNLRQKINIDMVDLVTVSRVTSQSATLNFEDGTRENEANDGLVGLHRVPITDIVKTKIFYGEAFGWKFTDYGPDYTSFESGRLAGGFSKG